MNNNHIYNSMLSAYQLTTSQDLSNATFEVNQLIILAGIMVDSSMLPPSMVVHIYASSMVCSDSAKTWTSHF